VQKKLVITDIMKKPEAFLGLSAFLTFVIGVWEGRIVLIFVAFVVGISAMLSLGVLASPMLKPFFPILSISTIFGLLQIFYAIELLGWTGGVVLVSGLISLFATYRILVLKRQGIGVSEEVGSKSTMNKRGSPKEG
jgi:hypothetical protein